MGWSRIDTLPDLTGQLSRTSEYATSFGGLSDIWRCVLKTNDSVVVVSTIPIFLSISDDEITGGCKVYQECSRGRRRGSEEKNRGARSKTLAFSAPFTSVCQYRGFCMSARFGQDLDTIILSRCTVPHLASVHSLHWFVRGTKMDRFQVIWSFSARLCPWLIASDW
jgi:hypothetical protein